MPDVRIPGHQWDPGLNAGYRRGRNRMWMPVWHWTVGRDSRALCRDRGLCQVLYPKVGAPWQFAEIDAICFHAGSAVYGDYNDDGPGFEVERFPDEPLTPDQVFWIGHDIAWLEREWGVPATHYWGPRFPPHQADYHGHVNHAQLHSNNDGLSREEWDLVTAGTPAPAPPLGDPMYIIRENLDNGGWNYWYVRGDGEAWKMSEAMAAAFHLGQGTPAEPKGMPIIPMGFLGFLSLSLAGAIHPNQDRVL